LRPIDVVRRYDETFDFALMGADIEWNVLPDWPAGGRYVGPRGVKEFFAKIFAAFAEYGARCDDTLETPGNVVVTSGVYHGRIRASPDPSAVRFVLIWTVGNGRLVRLDQVADTAAMLAVLRQSGPVPTMVGASGARPRALIADQSAGSGSGGIHVIGTHL
jgi:hypothetical protein